MAKEIQVVLVDGEEVAANRMESLFGSEPYGILVTGNPNDAKEALKTGTIKVVVCALQPPTTGGLQFLREVKDAFPGTVRIVLAAEAVLSIDGKAALDSGVEGILQKPFRTEELISAIRQAIRSHDLTAEIKNLQNEVRRLQIVCDDQKDITNIVSHELRTPLASIKAAIDLVVKKMLGPINQQQNDVLKRAQESIDRLKMLTDEILDLAKLEAKMMKLIIKNTDINTSIRAASNVHRKVAEAKGLYLKTKLDDNIPWVQCDQQRIDQVLNNLLSNALKYTEKGGVIVVSELDAKNRQVLVSVRDTGRGIAEENVAIVFEKFQRVESGNDGPKGTGLGLAISRAIVQSHNGKIWAESELGKGSSFNFILPIERSETTSK